MRRYLYLESSRLSGQISLVSKWVMILTIHVYCDF